MSYLLGHLLSRVLFVQCDSIGSSSRAFENAGVVESNKKTQEDPKSNSRFSGVIMNSDGTRTLLRGVTSS